MFLLFKKEKRAFALLLNVAGPAGFEPTIRESKSLALPLGYGPICQDMGRPKGIEPSSTGATIRRVHHFATAAMS